MRLTRFSSIRSKLFALFLVGAVLPLALVSLLSYFNSLKAVEQMVGNRTTELARRVGTDLSRKLERRLGDHILVENRPAQDFLAAVDAGNSAESFPRRRDLRLYLARLFEEYGSYYDEAIYADASGRPVFRFHRSEGAASMPELAGLSTSPPRKEPTGEGRRLAADSLKAEVEARIILGKDLQQGLRVLRQTIGVPDSVLDEIARYGGKESGGAEALPSQLAALIRGTLDTVRRFDAAVGPARDRLGSSSSGTLLFPAYPSLIGFTEQDRNAARQGLQLSPGEVRVFTDCVAPGNTRILRVLMPVFSVDDPARRLGTLVADLRMGYLFPQNLMGERFGSKGELAVVDTENGEILFHTRPEMVGRNLRLADSSLLRALRNPKKRDSESPWVKAEGRDGTRLAAEFGLSAVPWKVFATAVPLEFETEARRAGYRNLLIATLAVLLAGAVILVFGGRISASIKDVTRGARRISEGNLDHSIRVHTHDEIQTLGETFNAMTASLRESIAMRDQAARELELLNQTLEDRVQERTRKLETLNEALNQANQELTELDRLKSHFLSTVSHEFKTPLTSIKAFAEILLDEADSRQASEEMKRFLGIINSESDRLGRLIRNLLNMSRLESGRMLWRMTVFPVKEVVDAAVDGLLPAFRSKDVKLVRNTYCPGARFHADRDRIQEVITNLLENAVKFSGQGERVWIGCGQEQGPNGQTFLRVSVRDEGPGIPADHLERIFDRFSQVDASDTRSKGGTGLGLAICKEIVEHHGGRIWAESGLGEGTTFHFSLPLVREGEQIPASDVSTGRPAPRGGEEEHHA